MELFLTNSITDLQDRWSKRRASIELTEACILRRYMSLREALGFVETTSLNASS